MKMKIYKDHKGVAYATEREMCMAYHVNASTYINRRKRGWTLEEALTKPVRTMFRFYVKDCYGKVYHSKEEMCHHWGLTAYVFNTRQRKGWDLERTLITPSRCSRANGRGQVSMMTT